MLRWAWLGVTASSCITLLTIGLAAVPQEEAQQSQAADLLRAYTTPATLDDQGRAIDRPTLDPAAYQEVARQLRTIYSQPRKDWPSPHVEGDVDFVELGPVPAAVFPDHNPYSEAKAELGKMLFFDPRLSGSRQMACASCHDPDLAWADGKTVSFGHHRTALKRNAPSLLNVAHTAPLFWDGRAPTLEAQALEVIENPDEMHAQMHQVLAHLQASPPYVQRFKDVFDLPADNSITPQHVAMALATFQRTLISTGRADFDRFTNGDPAKLSDAAVRGLHLFRTVARCVNCHHGPTLSDNQFHDLGLSYFGRKYEDLGRYRITQNPKDVGKFKTPSLRNVTRTAPYMHLGLFNLDGVINMYDAGMATLRRKPHEKDDPLFPTKSHLLRPLGLTKQDKADLIAFLESLEEPFRRIRPPELPPMPEAKE